MKIIHVASEMAPLAKAGGLGDVVSGLCKVLAQRDHKVEIFLPAYGFLLNHPFSYDGVFFIEEKGGKEKISILSMMYHHCKIILLKSATQKKYFSRKNIYDYKDDNLRFVSFCYLCHQYLLQKKEKVDILHLHDWQSSSLALLCKERPLQIKNIILSLHNPLYQNSISPTMFTKMVKLSSKKLIKSSLLQNTPQKSLNLLKMGIIYSGHITTVSPSYAKELEDKKNSKNLFSLIRKYKHKIHGILNGIDAEIWDPQKDPHIQQNYHKDNSLQKLQAAKEKNKIALRRLLHLSNKDTFLVANIGRLAKQKGIDLIADALEYTLAKQGQFVLLGVCESKTIEKKFRLLQKKYHNNPNVCFRFQFDETLSRCIYSGSDFIVIPSFYEPCGLTQMIAFRYGCIPIARKTGGLADTVIANKTGYIFEKKSTKALRLALDKAFDIYKNHTKKHQQLVKDIMQLDYSWESATKKYLKIYHLSVFNKYLR